MSYQVLARKWRPKNFSQVVGQQHVLTALSNALDQNKVHHAYLFSGTRGVGKTTIARIFAKSLNCINGVTSEPCGKCENCLSIDEGRFVDLLEIDAASRTKVDDTRELLDNVQYKPAIGKYKVYLIDEVHMLSKHSFNALLKTLEEPPEYVKFLLATTDPQKLPITVLSRCLQFHLKIIQPADIEAQLSFILQQEKSTFEHSALAVIAKAADGSMRDALSLTDQALAFGSGNIVYQDVLKMLGTIDHQHLYYLLHFIVSGNVEKVFEKIEELVYLGADFGKLHQDLAALCHEIALNQLKPAKNETKTKTKIQLLCDCLSPEEVQLYYQIATQGYKDYAYAPSGKIALEMTVMRLLAFKPATQIECPDPVMVPSTVNVQKAERLVVPEQINQIEAVPSAEHSVNHAQQDNHDQQGASAQQDNEHQITSNVVQAEPVVERSDHVEYEPAIYEQQQNEEQTQTQISQIVTTNLPSIENIIPDVVAAETPIMHSRNMLRSHREKRQQAKKAQATTETPSEQASPTVVVAPSNSNTQIKTAEHILETIQKAETEPVLMPSVENIPLAEVISPQYPTNDLVTDPVIENKQLISNFQFTAPAYFTAQMLGNTEIDITQYVADKLTDPWSIAIKQMQLSGLVKLLAKNAVMKQTQQHISLTLKPAQQHLLNNPSLGSQLEESIKSFYGDARSLYIEVGEVVGELTAQESEFAIYEQYLNKAKQSLVEDENINQFVSAYDAKIYENSIIPL